MHMEIRMWQLHQWETLIKDSTENTEWDGRIYINKYKSAQHDIQPHFSKKWPEGNIQERIVFLTPWDIFIVWMLVWGCVISHRLHTLNEDGVPYPGWTALSSESIRRSGPWGWRPYSSEDCGFKISEKKKELKKKTQEGRRNFLKGKHCIMAK